MEMNTMYTLRPSWRPRYQPNIHVPTHLSQLTGDHAGRPPRHLWWQPNNIDFADNDSIRMFYNEAVTHYMLPSDNCWFDAALLQEQWRNLNIPHIIRHAWETIHPQLKRNTMGYNIDHWQEIQDTILQAIEDYNFALAGGSALRDYDVIKRETEDVDTFNNNWDVADFDNAVDAIVKACNVHGWNVDIIENQEMRRHLSIDNNFLVVSLVYYGYPNAPESRPGGGLRLVFDDVVGGKAAAIADAPRGRDFHDLAHILLVDGWSLSRIEDTLRNMNRGDQVQAFWESIENFRRGTFDDDIKRSGFDVAFCHSIIG